MLVIEFIYCVFESYYKKIKETDLKYYWSIV